uniref:receptor protein-tyrosine kinase n=1 Tax=Knipowitschia caucasica TaxID=637954 RepID=A0AAV2K4F0_KNICA
MLRGSVSLSRAEERPWSGTVDSAPGDVLDQFQTSLTLNRRLTAPSSCGLALDPLGWPHTDGRPHTSPLPGKGWTVDLKQSGPLPGPLSSIYQQQLRPRRLLQACHPGFFKAFAGNIKCSKCPPHSISFSEGSAVCRCEAGFYRADKDPPTMACTRPPSAPRNPMFNLNDSFLLLEWSPPSDSGGRRDLTYNVQCKRCGSESEQCRLCDEELRFLPRPLGLTNATVTVTDFSAHANYTFEIESMNGVSDLSSFPRQVAFITVSTDQGGPSVVGVMKKDWASPNSIALSWQQPEQTALLILEYEVKYYEKEHEQTSYSSTRTRAPSVIVSGLKPATWYVFSVRTRTAAGYSSYSPKYEYETTGDSSDLAADQGQVLVIVTAAVGGFTLLVILTLFLLITGRCQWYIKAKMTAEDKRRASYQNGLVPFPGIKTYVDPDTYEDPTQAVHEFTKEIDPCRIRIERVIGAGEFGEVCSGRLRTPGKKEIAVAIKTLKGGYVERQRRDFLREASIMGQFDHPNIIRLEGVVTKRSGEVQSSVHLKGNAFTPACSKSDPIFTISAFRFLDIGLSLSTGWLWILRDTYCQLKSFVSWGHHCLLLLVLEKQLKWD